MKLAVSNIAWNTNDEEQIFLLLKNFHIKGIEIAPTKIWENPTNEHDSILKNYKHRLLIKNFAVPSIQAILFNHPELKIFSNEKIRFQTLTYILQMIMVAANLGAKIIVFGSPKNRAKGDLAYKEAVAIAEEFFIRIADECKKYDIYFCLEPNAEAYGCDFLITTKETVKFIEKLNHPNLKINLDSGNMMLNKENIDESVHVAAEHLSHFQISEPNLLPLRANNETHRTVSNALRAINYNKWLSVETRNTNLDDLENSIQVAKQYYEF